MSDWIAMPTLATGDVIRVDLWVDVWRNLQTLKNVEFALDQVDQASNWTTTSSSFVPLSAYELDFTSYGNPVLIYAGIRFDHEASVGLGAVTLYLDGVNLGSTNGLAYLQDINNHTETTAVAYLVDNLEAGDHQLRAYYRTITVNYDLKVYGKPGLPIFVLEL